MIAVSEKYALPVSAPMPISSQRQHHEYLSVLDALASKNHPTSEEEKYAEVLMTLIEAYEEEYYSIPDASAVDVLRTLMEARDLRQKDLVPSLDPIVSYLKSCTENVTSTKPTSRN